MHHHQAREKQTHSTSHWIIHQCSLNQSLDNPENTDGPYQCWSSDSGLWLISSLDNASTPGQRGDNTQPATTIGARHRRRLYKTVSDLLGGGAHGDGGPGGDGELLAGQAAAGQAGHGHGSGSGGHRDGSMGARRRLAMQMW